MAGTHKAWKRPELTVLQRADGAEAVLIMCKNPASGSTGSSSYFDACWMTEGCVDTCYGMDMS